MTAQEKKTLERKERGKGIVNFSNLVSKEICLNKGNVLPTGYQLLSITTFSKLLKWKFVCLSLFNLKK